MNEEKRAGVPRYLKDMLRRGSHHYGGHQLTEIARRPIDDRLFGLLKQHQRGRVNSMLFSPDTAWASPGPGSIDARRSRMIANLPKHNAREALRKPEEITKSPARKKESAVNENRFVLQGKIAAVEKLGIGPLLGLIGRGALAGGLGGAIPGAISGAIAAPEGRGWSGAARGALGGAAGGALLGGAAGGFAGRGLSAAGKRTLSGIASPVRAARAGEEGTARVQQILARQPQLQQPFARGAAGVAGGSLIGGITGGAMAAPSPEPTRMQQFQQLLQKTHGSMAGTGMPFLQ